MRTLRLGFVALLAMTLACRGDAPPGFGDGDRRMLEVTLDTAWVVLSGLQDTTLTFPRHSVRAPDGRVYVTDRGDKVIAFDAAGSVLWTFGRGGEGPEEFQNINDIRLHEGLLYLPDAGNNRIAVVDTSGAFQRYITPAVSIVLSQIVRLEDGRIATLSFGGIDGQNIVILNDDGTLSATEAVPLPGYEDLPALASQGRLAQDGNQWVFGYSLSDGWATFDGDSAMGVVSRFIERIRTPEVVKTGSSESLVSPGTTVCTACSLTMSDSIVYVLFGGRTPENRAVVDLYDFADGGYLGSFLLPDRAYEISVSAGQLVMLMLRPVPHVVTLDMAHPPLADLRASRPPPS